MPANLACRSFAGNRGLQALALLSTSLGNVGLQYGCAVDGLANAQAAECAEVQGRRTIAQVQGPGARSPQEGQSVTVRGVVSGDFQGKLALEGFFLQELQPDGDPLTSDGLFVYAPGAADVSVGDVLQVSGQVKEYQGLTELAAIERLTRCGRAPLGEPPAVEPWPNSTAEKERWEGMRVRIDVPRTVTDTRFLGDYGTVGLGVGGGLGAGGFSAGHAAADFWLDDGSWRTQPVPVPYLIGEADQSTLRRGTPVSALRGLWSFGFGGYRLHPTQTPQFDGTLNRRPPAPRRRGRLRIASFNLHNWFVTLNRRGARTAIERDRQLRKLATAILGMQADVLALQEVENPSSSALQALQQALSEGAPGARWQAVQSTVDGRDEIAVHLLHRADVVTTEGAALRNLSSDFERPPIAQVFRQQRGSRLLLVAAHLKSKGSCPKQRDDPNADDGQGCWGARRLQQARLLDTWIAELQRQLRIKHVLLIGDMNAGSEEAPLTALQAAGWRDLVAAHRPAADRYSFVYQGRAQLLDHALATAALASQVIDTAVWHINADEPELLDYRVWRKVDDRYAPHAYRSSDHDPLLVDLYRR